MQFTPKSEEELMAEDMRNRGVLPPGEYQFYVIKSLDTTSKKGNPMIELELEVFPNNPDEASKIFRDWLLEAMAFKLRHFCAATGLMDKYSAGSLKAQDCMGKSGICIVGIQQDKEKKFPPKSKIADYAAKSSETALKSEVKSRAPVQNDLEDEDIPF